ncbi:MAG: PDZ domain-containing protein, partial [Planctomycetes bacterium]|nr:PDZ domain-containing protein [Planctomycetota bacterium]
PKGGEFGTGQSGERSFAVTFIASASDAQASENSRATAAHGDQVKVERLVSAASTQPTPAEPAEAPSSHFEPSSTEAAAHSAKALRADLPAADTPQRSVSETHEASAMAASSAGMDPAGRKSAEAPVAQSPSQAAATDRPRTETSLPTENRVADLMGSPAAPTPQASSALVARSGGAARLVVRDAAPRDTHADRRPTEVVAATISTGETRAAEPFAKEAGVVAPAALSPSVAAGPGRSTTASGASSSMARESARKASMDLAGPSRQRTAKRSDAVGLADALPAAVSVVRRSGAVPEARFSTDRATDGTEGAAESALAMAGPGSPVIRERDFASPGRRTTEWTPTSQGARDRPDERAAPSKDGGAQALLRPRRLDLRPDARPPVEGSSGRARPAAPVAQLPTTGSARDFDRVVGPRQVVEEGQRGLPTEAQSWPSHSRSRAVAVTTSGAPRGASRPLVATRGPEPAPRDLLARRRADLRLQDEAPAFASRRGTAKTEALQIGGGSAETEAAVLAGLRYLADHMHSDGSIGRVHEHEKYGDLRIGKTGLALLAFLGSGHTHDAAGPFREKVKRGIDFLLAQQDPVTGHFGDCNAYGHGIASYALAEAHAMTRDAALRDPLMRALRRIIRAQNATSDDRLRGGWGYFYRDPSRRFDDYPRVSVTVWQLMALKSGTIGGLTVPDAVFERARSFIEASWDPSLDALRYNQDPKWLQSAYPTLPGSTAAGLFAMQLLDVDQDDPLRRRAVEYLRQRPPRFRWRRPSDRDFVREAQGNLYFHYYAALSLHREGGSLWKAWNAELKPLLVENQQRDGSWKPISPYAEYADDQDGDRCYTTAMCVLMLEVYYRYFTPLLDRVADGRSEVDATDRGGLRVVSVTARRSADRAGLRDGDEILEVGGVRISSVASLREALDALDQRGESELLVRRARELVRLRFRGGLGGFRVQE